MSLPHAQSQRGIQIERVFRLASILRSRHFAVTIRELCQEIADTTGRTWHERTIHRDLLLLEYCGMVKVIGGRCRWIGDGLLEVPAERIGRSRDATLQKRY